MCVCDPGIKTPYCGKGECVWAPIPLQPAVDADRKLMAYQMKRQGLELLRQGRGSIRIANELLGLPADDMTDVGADRPFERRPTIESALRDASLALDRCAVLAGRIVDAARKLQGDSGIQNPESGLVSYQLDEPGELAQPGIRTPIPQTMETLYRGQK